MHTKTLSVEMSKREKLFGLLYLPFYLFVFSIFLKKIVAVYYPTLGNRELNLLYYLLCGGFTLLFFWDFLVENFRVLRGKEKQLLRELPGSVLCYYAVSIAFGIAVTLLENVTGESFSNQNDLSLMELYGDAPWMLVPIAVVLAPLVEEALFRGMIFANLQRRNMLLAYAVTAVCFSAIHVVGYELSVMGFIISMLQYVPATLFLCRIYMRTDSLFGAIALHSTLNGISVLITFLLNGG